MTLSLTTAAMPSASNCARAGPGHKRERTRPKDEGGYDAEEGLSRRTRATLAKRQPMKRFRGA